MLGPMNGWRILLLLLLVPQAAVSEVYRWVDDEGNIVFSDTPRPGAETVQISEPMIVPSGPSLRPRPPDDNKVKSAVPYASLEISSPTNEQTFRNVSSVGVSVDLVPRLQTAFGHKLQLHLDGAPASSPGTSTSFSLTDLERGAHHVNVVVVDAQGTVFASSPTVTFFLHKQSINRAN